MTPLKRWLLPLGLACSCLTWVGCGGSSEPVDDAGGNGVAQTGADPAFANAAPAPKDPAPAPEATAAAPAAKEAPEPAADSPKTAEAAPAADSATAPAPAAEATAETTPPASTSSTSAAEMLALGNKATAPAASDASAPTSASGGPGSSAPGGSGAMPFPGSASGVPGAMPPVAAAGAGIAPPGTMQPPGSQSQEEMRRRMMAMQNQGAAANMPVPPGGGPGGADPGGVNNLGGGQDVPAGFHQPMSAAQAFLVALKAKDPERLREATALRAPYEAAAKNQKLFTNILEQSLGEDGISDLANKLDGFKITGTNDAKSSGRLGVIVAKPGKNGDYFTRTITVRHEKAGWKVVDISGERKVERPIVMPGRGRMGFGGRRR